MSLLIDPTGKVFENEAIVNQHLSPVQIGKFEISIETKEFINKELNDSNTDQLFGFIPEEMDQFCRQDRKLIPTKASIFRLNPQEKQQDTAQKRSESSQTPHINEGNEIHFIFEGSYIIYFNIKDQHYSLIVQAGDWLYIPSNVEHWIKPTEDNYLIIVSYHCEPFDLFHTKVRYTTTESKAFL